MGVFEGFSLIHCRAEDGKVGERVGENEVPYRLSLLRHDLAEALVEEFVHEPPALGCYIYLRVQRFKAYDGLSIPLLNVDSTCADEAVTYLKQR